VTDIHTPVRPGDRPLLLWGVDELLTYHYLVAEVFRREAELDYDAFWPCRRRPGRSDLAGAFRPAVAAFPRHAAGVLTVLQALGIDGNVRVWRAPEVFAARRPERTSTGLQAGERVEGLHDNDHGCPGACGLDKGFERDPRFLGVLRLDSVVMAGRWGRTAAANWVRRRRLSFRLHPWRGEAVSRRVVRPGGCALHGHQPAAGLRLSRCRVAGDHLMTRAVFPVALQRGIPGGNDDRRPES